MKCYHRNIGIASCHIFPPTFQKKKQQLPEFHPLRKSRRHRGFAVVIVGGVHLHAGIFAWLGGGEEKNWEILGLKMVGR